MIQKIQQVNPTNFNEDYIKWDPKFALGIGYIDDQHKHLVELCNAKFLYDWVLSHIAHEDKLYVEPVREFKRAREGK